MMAICTGLGWYAWKNDMDITFICYWGMMSVFKGVFELVQLIDTAVKSPMPMFSSAAGAEYNLIGGLQLAIPLSGILAGVLAWRLYKDASCDPMERQADAQRGLRQGLNVGRATSGYTAFAGSGTRLGDAV